MFWFALAGVALSALQAGSKTSAGNTQALNNYTDSLKATNAQNDAITEANLTNTIRTGYRVGIQNLQKARLVQEAAEQGFSISAKGIEALSANQANAAASGTVGASVDAAAEDIRKKQAEALIDNEDSFQQQMENANLAIEQTIMQGVDALITPRDVNNTQPRVNSTITAALMTGAGTALSLYAESQLSLGLPQKQDIPPETAYRSINGPLPTYGATATSKMQGLFQ